LSQTVSTNDEAKILALQGAAEGTVVLAEAQTGGRGRQGRRFASPPGVGIYLSLLLRPSVDASRLPQLTLMAAVAAADALAEMTALPVCLKWPNDLNLHGKKIGGILTEAVIQSDLPALVIMGIGINVNTTLAHLPSNLHPHVTSLALAAGRSWPRLPLIASLLGHLERCYETFQSIGMQPIIERWLHYGQLVGRRVRFDLDAIPQDAIVLGLAEDGALHVQLADGSRKRLIAGTVAFL
jgi:BirA family biotin operon repressor/biotin-[acetyl-CoA-carboxylase] ligase